MSKTHLVCHVVFGTKNRCPAIKSDNSRYLYAYLYGILKNNKCDVLRINGMTDHVHILFVLNPTIALSSLMRDLKQSSSHWLKGNPSFPLFEAWAKGYFAESVGNSDIERCRQYIINQHEHHSKSNFLDEMKYLTASNGIEYLWEDWE